MRLSQAGLLVACGLVVSVLSACSDDAADQPNEDGTPTVPILQPTQSGNAASITPNAKTHAAAVAAMEAYAADQDWNVVGLCSSEEALIALAGNYCYFEPLIVNEETTIAVGLVSSGFVLNLILQRQPNGTFTVTDAIQFIDQ